MSSTQCAHINHQDICDRVHHLDCIMLYFKGLVHSKIEFCHHVLTTMYTCLSKLIWISLKQQVGYSDNNSINFGLLMTKISYCFRLFLCVIFKAWQTQMNSHNARKNYIIKCKKFGKFGKFWYGFRLPTSVCVIFEALIQINLYTTFQKFVVSQILFSHFD